MRNLSNFASRQFGLIGICGDHIAVGFDPRLSVHFKRIRIGMGRKVGRINRKGLVFVFQIKILLKIARIDRFIRRAVAAVFGNFEIPPPLFDAIQTAITNRIIKLCQ